MTLLEIQNVSKHFGGLKAVDQVDLTIEKGQIYGLIGPNGAGKSTLFNCVAGSYAPTSGKILYDGEDITGWKPWNICRNKIARTFQIVKPFQTKTVLYNTVEGARSIKPELIEVAKSFRSSEWALWREVMLPYTLPYMMTGVRQAIGRAKVAAGSRSTGRSSTPLLNAAITASRNCVKCHTSSVSPGVCSLSYPTLMLVHSGMMCA